MMVAKIFVILLIAAIFCGFNWQELSARETKKKRNDPLGRHPRRPKANHPPAAINPLQLGAHDFLVGGGQL